MLFNLCFQRQYEAFFHSTNPFAGNPPRPGGDRAKKGRGAERGEEEGVGKGKVRKPFPIPHSLPHPPPPPPTVPGRFSRFASRPFFALSSRPIGRSLNLWESPFLNPWEAPLHCFLQVCSVNHRWEGAANIRLTMFALFRYLHFLRVHRSFQI